MLKVICGQCYGICNFYGTQPAWANAQQLIKAKCNRCNIKHWKEMSYPIKANVYAQTHLLTLIMYPYCNRYDWFPPMQLIPEIVDIGL